jgi:hypothetical protein
MRSTTEKTTTLTMKICVVGSALLFVTTVAHPQSLVFHLLNGDSGKPFGDQNLTIEWDPSFNQSILALGSDGTGSVAIPRGATSFVMLGGPKKGSEPNRVAYIDCNDSTPEISVENALKEGIVPSNRCGKCTVTAKPGEVIYWARPLPFWMPDLQ